MAGSTSKHKADNFKYKVSYTAAGPKIISDPSLSSVVILKMPGRTTEADCRLRSTTTEGARHQAAGTRVSRVRAWYGTPWGSLSKWTR